ncbi:hypothetical protein MKW98_004936, partial [Papaver atlanticum]
KFASTFSSDMTPNLIVRLRHNVIRTGLCNISISYSFSHFTSKTTREGAMDATLDHATSWMVSKETGDVYFPNEPQSATNSRIAFCRNMYTEAVRALRFPPDLHKEKESAENRRKRRQQEQGLAKHISNGYNSHLPAFV